MSLENWRGRLLESTRGRVVRLLRRAPRTVRELAQELSLTDNAVRLHLAALERDGLIHQDGTRREWTGKPAVLYRSTLEAETLFPQPYAQVLEQLLSVLEERVEAAELDSLLRATGSRLANGGGPVEGDRRARFERAAEVLNSLGGLAEVQEAAGDVLLQGYGCPLGAVTREHPGACQLAETLVSVLVGEPVLECCERGERPRCAFRAAGG